MIEWVPIKEFIDTVEKDETFLVLIVKDPPKFRYITQGCKEELVINTGEWGLFNFEGVTTHFDGSLTHAAKINYPIEKTLEEKFDDYYGELSKWGFPYDKIDLITGLAAVAKKHYEKDDNE